MHNYQRNNANSKSESKKFSILCTFKGIVASDCVDPPESGMVGQALMGIKTADGKQNLKFTTIFVYFKISSPNGILLT
jgi:hypothetical protein